MSKKVRAKAGNVKGSRPDFIQLQERALRKKTLFCLCAVTAALGAGCGNDADKDNVVYLTNKPHAIVERSFDMNSKVGCALDSDCSDGMFCFHGQIGRAHV